MTERNPQNATGNYEPSPLAMAWLDRRKEKGRRVVKAAHGSRIRRLLTECCSLACPPKGETVNEMVGEMIPHVPA